jgi:alpha-tubulin suppressor-like RCC1 family protein
MATRITANNIVDNAITSNKIAAGAVTSAAIANGSVTFAQTAAGAFSLIPTITAVRITDASYNVLDDTAANTSGGFIEIAGSNFSASSLVTIGSNNATSTTFVNTAILRAQITGAAPASYPVYVTDTATGATAIRVNGLTYSSFPAWGTGATLSTQTTNTAFAVALSATSDSNITYSNTTALPAGTTLLANGYFFGTISTGNTTTFSFDVKANDAENQDASRTFSLTIATIFATRLYSWGNSQRGRLGHNNTTYRSSPTQVGTNTNWSSNVSIGLTFSAGIKTDGTLWTWGGNGSGQLGLNSSGNYLEISSPTQVGASTNWSDVKVGNAGTLVTHTAAIKTDGTLWLWGSIAYSALGLPTAVNKSSPTQVGTNTNWGRVSIAVQHSAAIKTDGTLWLWGKNSYGQTGFNTASGYTTSPTQLGTGTDWRIVSAGRFGTGAIKTNGTLWMWGTGTNGKLGVNSAINISSPVQVGSATNWDMISIREYHALATKTDGTLWVWGNGTTGQLGLNEQVNKSSPTQVGTGTNWSKVDMDSQFSIATKTDGTLWAWGRNSNGTLGLNDRVYRSSPVQIGSQTNWSSISAGNFSVLGVTSSES